LVLVIWILYYILEDSINLQKEYHTNLEFDVKKYFFINYMVLDLKSIKEHFLYLRGYNLLSYKFVHSSWLEGLWTLLPAILLLLIAYPSFTLLYFVDNFVVSESLIVKVIGHQWFWSYEVYSPNFDLKVVNSTITFDSYMISEDDLKEGDLRLLSTDNPLYLPSNVNLQVLVTSDDVLHSWTIPSFGVKVDAVPGRLNQLHFNIFRNGIFYGQCSEICGANHGFMPIEIICVPFEDFINIYLQ
jgi:heme/copper-type cytochrome/quinol oxidase subunit 2